MYERETSWAPPHVGEELRLARLQARTAWENAIRADHEARAATGMETIQRHEGLARMWRAMEAKATLIADTLAETQETRRQWDALTESTRRAAVAADIELRRRHPATVLEPLRSAEPAGICQADPVPAAPRRGVWLQETLDGAVHLAQPEAESDAVPDAEPPLTLAQREFLGRQALGLTPPIVHDDVPEQVHRIRENARQVQNQIDRLRGTPEYAEDDDAVYLGAAWGDLHRRDRDAILQPPKPDMVPASAILQRVRERQAATEPEHA
jgi:hypothetical protein